MNIYTSPQKPQSISNMKLKLQSIETDQKNPYSYRKTLDSKYEDSSFKITKLKGVKDIYTRVLPQNIKSIELKD